MANLSINLGISIEDLVDSFQDYEGARDLILALDLKMADAEFTESIILSLVKSLMKDYPKEEMMQLINDITNLVKEIGNES